MDKKIILSNNYSLIAIMFAILIVVIFVKAFLFSTPQENKLVPSATPISSPTVQINNGKFVWEGGKYTDTNMKISFVIPKGWSINPLGDDKNPGLQIFSNNQALVKGKPKESDLIEKIEILRTKKTDSNNDTSSDNSEVILSESTIQLNNKYNAKRTDVSSTWSGFKKNITYLRIEYKDQIIGFAIYNTEFFNRPETQALFNSIEISD